jgi:hypothetical protein
VAHRSRRITPEQASPADHVALACAGDARIPAAGRPAGRGWPGYSAGQGWQDRPGPGMKRRPRRCGPGEPPPRDQAVTGKPSAAPERAANLEPSAARDQPVTGKPSPAPEQAAACGQSTACEQVATREQPASRERASGRDARTDRGAAALAAFRAGPGPMATVRAGVREPIVVVLLLIAFFTSISGKPLDGLLMLVAGVSLAWDTARRSRRASPTARGLHGDGQPGRSEAESRPADLSPPEHHHSADRAVTEPAAPGTIPGETAPAAAPGVERAGTLARHGEPLAARPRRRLLAVG